MLFSITHTEKGARSKGPQVNLNERESVVCCFRTINGVGFLSSMIYLYLHDALPILKQWQRKVGLSLPVQLNCLQGRGLSVF